MKSSIQSLKLKFGLSQKHTKFKKNLPHGFDKSADLLSKCQNHETGFFKLCVLIKKSEVIFFWIENCSFKLKEDIP